MAPSKKVATSLLRTFQSQTRHYSAPLSSAIPASKQKYVPTSGTYPKGFLVSGIHVGIKASNTKNPDLALIASEVPCHAAAVFTTNKFQAAPVQVSKSILQKRNGTGILSIIINSGCANAVTGQGGLEDAHAMAATATSCFQQSNDDGGLGSNSLVMSTGVIGQRLPIAKILHAIPTAHAQLSSSHSSWLTTAKAICTTDTFPKLLSTTFTLPGPHHQGTTYSLAGMAKGAGMIHPNMATLLSIITTDAPIDPSALQSLLATATADSFNSISIDGDTSTNDTLALLSNGAASPSNSTPPIPNNTNNPDYISFSTTLTTFCQQLGQLIVRDGEGATKFISCHVFHAPSDRDAHLIASSIARSPLVKTALYGKDANWGRILCAIGYTQGLSDNAVRAGSVSVSFVPAEGSKSSDEGRLELLRDGEPQYVDEERAGRLLEDEDLEIEVDLGRGEGEDRREGEARYWFCDFSHEYVTINGDYRT